MKTADEKSRHSSGKKQEKHEILVELRVVAVSTVFIGSLVYKDNLSKEMVCHMQHFGFMDGMAMSQRIFVIKVFCSDFTRIVAGTKYHLVDCDLNDKIIEEGKVMDFGTMLGTDSNKLFYLKVSGSKSSSWVFVVDRNPRILTNSSDGKTQKLQEEVNPAEEVKPKVSHLDEEKTPKKERHNLFKQYLKLEEKLKPTSENPKPNLTRLAKEMGLSYQTLWPIIKIRELHPDLRSLIGLPRRDQNHISGSLVKVLVRVNPEEQIKIWDKHKNIENMKVRIDTIKVEVERVIKVLGKRPRNRFSIRHSKTSQKSQRPPVSDQNPESETSPHSERSMSDNNSHESVPRIEMDNLKPIITLVNGLIKVLQKFRDDLSQASSSRIK